MFHLKLWYFVVDKFLNHRSRTPKGQTQKEPPRLAYIIIVPRSLALGLITELKWSDLFAGGNGVWQQEPDLGGWQEPADPHGNWPWNLAETSATSQTSSPGALGWEKLHPAAGTALCPPAVIPTGSRCLDFGACRRSGAPMETAFINAFTPVVNRASREETNP